MKTLTNKQQAAFDTGVEAGKSFESSNAAGIATHAKLLVIVGAKATSQERKGFESWAIGYANAHAVINEKTGKLVTGSAEVKQLRASMAKLETNPKKQNWTIKFGIDTKAQVVNAAHVQRSTSAIAKKAIKSSKDTAIKGVKDLDALLDYAIENYGLESVVANLTARAAKLAA